MPIRNNREPISYSKSKSRIVRKLAEELGVDVKTLAIFWNRAKAKVALSNGCKIRVPDDYAIITEIFKREVLKYFPGAAVKYPKVFTKDMLTHRHPPEESLEEVLERYKKEIREAKKKCGGVYRIVHTRKRSK